jgi:putative membrane protein
MTHHLPRLSVVLAVVTAVFGCSSHKEKSAPAAQAPEQQPDRTTGAERNEATAPPIVEPVQPGSTIPSEREVQPQGPTADQQTADQNAASISDEQSIRILTTVNAGEVEQAQLAKRQAKDPRVKKFAAQMIDQHTKAKNDVTKLSKNEQLLPANSSVANDLADKGSQVVQSLKSVEGADFDKTYIDAQVQQHQEVLELLNSRLIPSANNTQLKAALEDSKKMVEHHLEMARQIQQQTQR